MKLNELTKRDIMKKEMKNDLNNIITNQEKLSQITYYNLKLEELCNKLQKQINNLNDELTSVKKQCKMQEEQINKLKQ